MEKDVLIKLKMDSRDEVVRFLKSLWSEQPQPCPLCDGKLDLFKKAKIKSDFIVSDVKDAITGVVISSKDSVDKIEKYRNGELQVLINVNILTEGIDLPQTKTVFLARPMVSKVLMTQMVGRALRGVKAGGTEKAYIVSFIDQWNEKIAWYTLCMGNQRAGRLTLYLGGANPPDERKEGVANVCYIC